MAFYWMFEPCHAFFSSLFTKHRERIEHLEFIGVYLSRVSIQSAVWGFSIYLYSTLLRNLHNFNIYRRAKDFRKKKPDYW